VGVCVWEEEEDGGCGVIGEEEMKEESLGSVLSIQSTFHPPPTYHVSGSGGTARWEWGDGRRASSGEGGVVRIAYNRMQPPPFFSFLLVGPGFFLLI